MENIRIMALCLLSFFPLAVTSQISESRVKETWDYMAEKKPYGSSALGLTDYILQVDPYHTYGYGEGLGFAAEGYVVMYETTKDKAYLIHALNRFRRAMAWRNTNLRFNHSLYKDGVLLWAMAHWVRVILSDPALSASAFNVALLEQNITSTNPNNLLPFSSIQTYEDVARWLMARIVESMDAIIAAHWSDNAGFSTYGGVHGLNQEAGLAGALLHLGFLSSYSPSFSGLTSYLDRGARMTTLLNQSLDLLDRCSCDWLCNCAAFSGPILRHDLQTNSYWWYHAGWEVTRRTCGSNCPLGLAINETNVPSYTQFIEDISHGILSLQLPLIASSIQLYTNGAYPYPDHVMARFRNMFTKKIYVPTQGGMFNNSVAGTLGPIHDHDNQTSAYYPPNLYGSQVFGYSKLYRYDNVSGAMPGPSVYTILANEYLQQGQQLLGTFSGGTSVYGLAEFVAAHWEKECFSLDLYKREVAYDQDFTAKNILRVFPAGESGASFAAPELNEPRFTVLENNRSTFRAGSAVIFEPGFEAARGSVVEAVIDPMGCNLSYKSASPVMGPTVVDLVQDTAPEVEDKGVHSVVLDPSAAHQGDAVLLSPNPSTDQAFAMVTLSKGCEVAITLVDGIGRTVWSIEPFHLPEGEHRLPLAPGLTSGIYHCITVLDGKAHSERLVVE